MKSQLGSVQIIIIGALAVGLIAALGFLFWQNIFSKPSEVEVTPIASVTPTAAPSPSVKLFCAPIEKLCFDYPNDWTVKSETVSQSNDGLAERFVVSDQSGKSWLRLETGMGGLGGACGNDDNSYAKILKTHTTKITGDYLVNESAKQYVGDTAYAVGWTVYNGTKKNWTIDMELNDSKAVQTIGKLDPCDIGIGVLNGKNAKADGSSIAGAVAFKYYTGDADDKTYATETEASAALTALEAVKAYEILQSAHYE